MSLTEPQRTFLEQQQGGAAMITLRPDGTPTAVRIGVALVDGQIWSSGTQRRRRTATLRRDPRSTLFLWEAQGGYRFLTIEARVTILEESDVYAQSVRLFRVMQHRPSGPLQWFGTEKTEAEFLAQMVAEERLIYLFEPLRAYGLLS